MSSPRQRVHYNNQHDDESFGVATAAVSSGPTQNPAPKRRHRVIDFDENNDPLHDRIKKVKRMMRKKVLVEIKVYQDALSLERKSQSDKISTLLSHISDFTKSPHRIQLGKTVVSIPKILTPNNMFNQDFGAESEAKEETRKYQSPYRSPTPSKVMNNASLGRSLVPSRNPTPVKSVPTRSPSPAPTIRREREMTLSNSKIPRSVTPARNPTPARNEPMKPKLAVIQRIPFSDHPDFSDRNTTPIGIRRSYSEEQGPLSKTLDSFRHSQSWNNDNASVKSGKTISSSTLENRLQKLAQWRPKSRSSTPSSSPRLSHKKM